MLCNFRYPLEYHNISFGCIKKTKSDILKIFKGGSATPILLQGIFGHFHQTLWSDFFSEIFHLFHDQLGGGFNYFLFHPYLGKWSNLTNIFQMSWNHQLVKVFIEFFFWHRRQVLVVASGLQKKTYGPPECFLNVFFFFWMPAFSTFVMLLNAPQGFPGNPTFWKIPFDKISFRIVSWNLSRDRSCEKVWSKGIFRSILSLPFTPLGIAWALNRSKLHELLYREHAWHERCWDWPCGQRWRG